MIVSLPMYDWPEVQSYNDHLWKRLRVDLLPMCKQAPLTLDRTANELNSFLLTQTCGLPLVTKWASNTVVLGTPHYAVEFCNAGYYASVIVVRSSDKRSSIDEFRSATIAVNSTDSQSGYNAVKNVLAIEGLATNSSNPFFAKLNISGSHREYRGAWHKIMSQPHRKSTLLAIRLLHPVYHWLAARPPFQVE